MSILDNPSKLSIPMISDGLTFDQYKNQITDAAKLLDLSNPKPFKNRN